MADLAVPLPQFLDVGCVEKACIQLDNSTSYSNKWCGGAQMLQAARCVVEDFDDDSEIHVAIWVTGGNPEVIPTPRVRKHEWKDQRDHNSYIVFALHTLDLGAEPAWNACSNADQNDGYGSLVVPCFTTTNISVAIQNEKEAVTGSTWVSRWLVEDYSTTAKLISSGHGKFNSVLLVPIIGGLIVAFGLLGLLVFIKRKRKEHAIANSTEEIGACSENMNPSLRDADPRYDDSNQEQSTAQAIVDNDPASHRVFSKTTYLNPAYQEEEWSNGTLKMLLGSEFLVEKRIPYENIIFKRVLSKEANGEVWLAGLLGQPVAVKRLLQNKTHLAGEVEEFAQEIQLRAHLIHPNIVTFVGVAWNSLYNLVMVLEFFPIGDLQAYLCKNFDLLSWAKDKLHTAEGIALALEYLHSRSPPPIHRDLKSKNVLLTRSLDAKLIDFGVTRGRQECSMTAGVGTPYWSAPEILEGKRYTEQADIYSFEVILTELDTGKLPYYDALTPEGNARKPFQILAEVMAGVLRQSFSEDCHRKIRQIGVSCCQHDPNRRPTAAQVVQMLKQTADLT